MLNNWNQSIEFFSYSPKYLKLLTYMEFFQYNWLIELSFFNCMWELISQIVWSQNCLYLYFNHQLTESNWYQIVNFYQCWNVLLWFSQFFDLFPLWTIWSLSFVLFTSLNPFQNWLLLSLILVIGKLNFDNLNSLNQLFISLFI